RGRDAGCHGGNASGPACQGHRPATGKGGVGVDTGRGGVEETRGEHSGQPRWRRRVAGTGSCAAAGGSWGEELTAAFATLIMKWTHVFTGQRPGGDRWRRC